MVNLLQLCLGLFEFGGLGQRILTLAISTHDFVCSFGMTTVMTRVIRFASYNYLFRVC